MNGFSIMAYKSPRCGAQKQHELTYNFIFSFRFVAGCGGRVFGVEFTRHISYSPKSSGDRRSSVGRSANLHCPTSSLFRHLGSGWRRSKGQSVHGLHLCHIVSVAGHHLSYPGNNARILLTQNSAIYRGTGTNLNPTFVFS